MPEVRFLAVGEAAQRVARDPQTIRNWANSGKVRRRQRGRIVEYHEEDLLAVAGLLELDAKDREIARLRVELEQAQRAKVAAEETATRRKQSNANLKAQAAQRYREKDATIVQLQAQVADLTKRNQAGRKRLDEVEAQVVSLTQKVQRAYAQQEQQSNYVTSWMRWGDRAVKLAQGYAALVGALMGVLTSRQHREEYDRLQGEFSKLEQEIQRLRGG
jgi:exonuclease VII large subunit